MNILLIDFPVSAMLALSFLSRGTLMWGSPFSWGVLGVLLTLFLGLIGLGAASMSWSPPGFLIAKICFSLAAAVLLCGCGWIIGVEWIETLHMVDNRGKTINLASCTFNGKFEVIGNIEAFRRAYPESGSATIIMEIFPKGMPNEGINIRLSGYWQGTTGIMPIYAEDSVVFILSELMFIFYHKKPIIEYATNKMTQLYAGKEYEIQLTGFPGFVVPLFPKLLNIRSPEGVIVPIQNFAPLKERLGWYYAIFKLG